MNKRKQRAFKNFMVSQCSVIDKLASDHMLEQDVINDIVRDHGDLMREGVELGYPASAVANVLASLKAGACDG